ncbi:MAG: ABC transporter ATP-binding protein [Solobacterium sp.]|nr:ABC transporter ATP-binding protein [Solobacterium sp.]
MDFEVKQVFFSYGDVLALNGISFSANRRQIVGLVGENGAGKSTIIKNIYRYLTPDSGTITLDGKDIFAYPSGAYPVSYIPDVPVFYEELSLLEHLHFIKAIYPQGGVSIDEMIERLDMKEHQNKIPAALSKGTRQKLMIAMALMREFELLIADEPFSGLDPKQIATLKALLLEQKEKGKIVLLSSHLLDVTENICDQYVVIKNGKRLLSGSKQELLSATQLPEDSTMEAVYLKLVEQDDEESS